MVETENTICENCGLDHLQGGIIIFDGWFGEGRVFCSADCVNNYFHYTSDHPQYYVDDEVEYEEEDDSNSICDEFLTEASQSRLC